MRTALLAGLLLIAAVVFAIELPPVQDYPNHLARYWLIAGGQNVAPTSGMFAIDWRYASTNIGADLLVAILVTALPYWLAGKLLLVACFAGPPAAAAWLNRILFGRWSWWSLSFLLLAWTTTSVFGFVNYQLALAAALLFACLDALIRWSAVPKFVARVVFGTAVLVIHPFGLVFFVLLLLALTIGPSWSPLFDRQGLFRIARDAVWPAFAGGSSTLLPHPTNSEISHFCPTGATSSIMSLRSEWTARIFKARSPRPRSLAWSPTRVMPAFTASNADQAV